MPRAPPLRALVTDLDGTITTHDRRLYPPAVLLLQELARRHVPVVLATGNVLPIALALHRLLGLDSPIVAENGGLLYFPAPPAPRVVRLARRAVALRALRKLRTAGLEPHVLFTDRWRETEVGLEPDLPVARARRILDDGSVEVVPTGYAVHLIERGAGKLPALTRALRPLGLSLGECWVAGDGENDIPMLEAAGWAVSFRGADAGARAAADVVTRGRNAVGLVEAVKKGLAVRSAPG